MAADGLSDDYVANLLKHDAKKHSKDYSLLGASAYMPQRPRINAPKTNLRFLNNLIKDTDNHNKALLAKEAQESKARLRSLGIKREKTECSSDDRPSKRRRADREEDDRKDRRDDDRKRKSHRSRRDRDDSDDTERRPRHDRREGRMRAFSDDGYDKDDQPSSRRSERKHRRSRSRSPTRSRHRRHGSRSRDRDRRREHRHRSPSTDQLNKIKHRRLPSDRRRTRSPSPARKQSTPDSDSDPLEAIVGPLPRKPDPTVRPRGRGAFTAGTSLDAHFDSKYDPSMDVSLDEDRNDWEDAVEAMKDRLMWQKKGAERLRAAGFTEDQVQRWEKGGEKNEEDVRWKKRGEGREWDRGKVVDEDGDIAVKPEWGRLKGT